MMKLDFKYDLEKEFTNLWCGKGSLNHSGAKSTEIEQEMIDQGIDLEDKPAVLGFFDHKMKSSGINIETKIESLSKEWQKISVEAETRFKKLFNTDHDLGEVSAYLTFAKRCGYNTDQRFFFVSVNRNHPNNTAIHELLHFYTHLLYEKRFKDQGLPYQDFNDFKEALTFLINTDFQDLLDDVDLGYDKQRELRKFLQEKWPSCENVEDLAHIMIEKFQSEQNEIASANSSDIGDKYEN
ncbi:MAG: hypothetical protein NTW50_00645 [Candidatus Berkelbacteria bacterium]|nr:hypothetical protein [Candidatus Berkelbacteria bacterium]